jgi:hypothetical protein
MQKMGKWLRENSVLVGLGIFVLFLAGWTLAMTFSDSYKECEGNRAAEYASPYNPGHYEIIASFFRCQGTSLDANGELLTAISTLAIAAFTLTLWLVTEGTLSLARDEFISSHRPKLRLRHLRMESPVLGEQMKLQFALSNIGDTQAEIAAIDVTLIIENALPVLDPASGNMVNKELRTPVIFPLGDIVAAGDSLTLQGVSVAYFNGTADPPDENWLIGRTEVTGTVTYADQSKVRRRTAFYRWLRELNRFEFKDFTRAQKRDWEYED